VSIQPGKIDRSPTGTSVSARMALLQAQGIMGVGDQFEARSIIGSTFQGRIVELTDIAGHPAIIPEISGRGWITGTHQHMLDPDDPWPEGYRLSDTWPRYR
jgi:proline racemase